MVHYVIITYCKYCTAHYVLYSTLQWYNMSLLRKYCTVHYLFRKYYTVHYITVVHYLLRKYCTVSTLQWYILSLLRKNTVQYITYSVNTLQYITRVLSFYSIVKPINLTGTCLKILWYPTYVESETGTLPQHLHVLLFTSALLLPPAARWRWRLLACNGAIATGTQSKRGYLIYRSKVRLPYAWLGRIRVGAGQII